MPFKVQVGPSQISIHQGQTVLITEEAGQIDWPSEKGLYFFDTRVISSWAIYANGERWDLLNGGAGCQRVGASPQPFDVALWNDHEPLVRVADLVLRIRKRPP